MHRLRHPAGTVLGGVAAILLGLALAGARADDLEDTDRQIAAAAAEVASVILARDPGSKYGLAFVHLAAAVDPDNDTASAIVTALERDRKVTPGATRLNPKQLVRGLKKRAGALYAEDVDTNPHYGRRALLYLRVAAVCTPDDPELTRGIEALARKGFDDDLESLLRSPAALRKPAAALAATGDTPEHVPPEATFFNGHWYQLIRSQKGWEDAVATCLALGGHLVCIDDEAENDFVYKLAGRDQVWLGGADRYGGDRWSWCNGQPWQFSAWAPNQPDNERGRHCLTYLDMTIGKPFWCSQHEGFYRYFVCEWGVKRWTQSQASRVQADAVIANAPEFKGHRYIFVDRHETWENAKKVAEEMGGYLAIINSPRENDFVHDLAKDQTIWLGASDMERADFWRWVDGKRVAYKNWQEYWNEDDKEGGYMVMGSDGKWYSTSHRSSSRRFVVEVEPAAAE